MYQSIQTDYAGDCFRSQLEVRWAIFFRTLGYKYEYEKHSYGLLSGWYLPDFWIPRLKVWVEVKPRSGGNIDTLRYRELALSTGCPHICVMGKPEPNRYIVTVQLPTRSSIQNARFAEAQNRSKSLILVQGHQTWEVRKGARVRGHAEQPALEDSNWISKASFNASQYFEDRG